MIPKSRMREICTSGSVGGRGGQPPRSTRHRCEGVVGGGRGVSQVDQELAQATEEKLNGSVDRGTRTGQIPATPPLSAS